MMKENMEMIMNAMRGWVSTNLVELIHWIDSLFTAQVNSFPFLVKFRILLLEAYDRLSRFILTSTI